jgi:hypothetical protein
MFSPWFRVWNNEPLYSLQVTLISPFIFIWRLPGSGLSTAFCTVYLLYIMYNTLNRLSVTELPQFLRLVFYIFGIRNKEGNASNIVTKLTLLFKADATKPINNMFLSR